MAGTARGNPHPPSPRADGNTRGVEDAAPYGGNGLDFVIARAGTARGNPHPPFPVAESERGDGGAQCAPLRAGLLPVACCLLPAYARFSRFLVMIHAMK